MTLEEYQKQHEQLTKQKKGYDANRTICVAIIVYLLYITFKNGEFTSTPWYILLIIGIVIVITTFLFIRDCILINKISKQIKELELKQP